MFDVRVLDHLIVTANVRAEHGRTRGLSDPFCLGAAAVSPPFFSRLRHVGGGLPPTRPTQT